MRLLREILDGTIDVVPAGIATRSRPLDLPPGQTVCHYHRLWRLCGVREEPNPTLRELVHQRECRDATPGAGIIESPSVNTTAAVGPRSDDGGETVTKRTRHFLVDPLELVMAIKVHDAVIHDHAGAVVLLRDRPVRVDHPGRAHYGSHHRHPARSHLALHPPPNSISGGGFLSYPVRIRAAGQRRCSCPSRGLRRPDRARRRTARHAARHPRTAPARSPPGR